MGFELKAAGITVSTGVYFVYLTENRKTKKSIINIMVVDPFYDEVQICLFKSTSFFLKEKTEARLNNEIIKSVVYNNGSEIKLV